MATKNTPPTSMTVQPSATRRDPTLGHRDRSHVPVLLLRRHDMATAVSFFSTYCLPLRSSRMRRSVAGLLRWPDVRGRIVAPGAPDRGNTPRPGPMGSVGALWGGCRAFGRSSTVPPWPSRSSSCPSRFVDSGDSAGPARRTSSPCSPPVSTPPVFLPRTRRLEAVSVRSPGSWRPSWPTAPERRLSVALRDRRTPTEEIPVPQGSTTDDVVSSGWEPQEGQPDLDPTPPPCSSTRGWWHVCVALTDQGPHQPVASAYEGPEGTGVRLRRFPATSRTD